MPVIPVEERAQVEKELKNLKDSVTLVIHEPKDSIDYTGELKELANELSGMDDRIKVKVVEGNGGQKDDVFYEVAHLPALVILDNKDDDHGIRFYASTIGRSMLSLVRDVVMFSTGDAALPEENKGGIEALEETNIKVLMIPTALDCAETIEYAHRISFSNSKITSSMINLTEFSDYAEMHHVLDFPKTIIDDEVRLIGPYKLEDIVDRIGSRISDEEEELL